MEEQQRRGALEAILFVAGEAVALEDVAGLYHINADE